MLKLVGYSDRLSVAPGESIGFKVSADGLDKYEAGIVRLIHGDANPDGPGFKCRPVEADANGSYPGRKQEIHAGSYVLVPDDPALALDSFTVAAMVWPTRPGKDRQTIVAKCGDGDGGFALGLDEEGCLSLHIADGRGGVEHLATGKPMLNRQWYLAAATFDAESGAAALLQRPLVRYALTDDHAEVGASLSVRTGRADAPLTIGAEVRSAADGRLRTVRPYNGKIDSPMIYGRAMGADELKDLYGPSASRDGLVADWDFSREIRTTRVLDAGPNGLHGTCVNLPARAMKGWNWTGEEMNWCRAPEQYGAIHFHDDDLYDAGWQTDCTWSVPESTPSGIYCAHIRSADGAHEDYMPFAVRPPRGRATARHRLPGCPPPAISPMPTTTIRSTPPRRRW